MANKGKKLSFKNLIFNDKYLIVISLILAVLVWIIASLNIGTDETRTIHVNVPITISDDLSKQLGMQYYTLQKSVDLEVTLSGAKYVIGQVSDKDLTVKFDTSNVNRAGAQSIPILVTNKSSTKDFTVTSVYPASLDAYFDVEETDTFDISLVYNQDNVADGYVFGSPVISEDKVVITGPKTYIDLIERVDAEVDFGKEKGLKESFTQDCTLSVKGSGVEQNYLTLTSKNDEGSLLTSVSVTLPVLKAEYLPVTVNFEDAPGSLNKKAVQVDYSTKKIYVGILESTEISKAVLGTISYNDISVGENKFTFDLDDVQGVFLIDDNDTEITVTVTVSEDYEEISVPITNSDVSITGAQKGKTAKLTGLDSTNIKLIVPKGTQLKASDLKIKADVSEENEDGIYPLQITVSDKSSWVKSTYSATISIE